MNVVEIVVTGTDKSAAALSKASAGAKKTGAEIESAQARAEAATKAAAEAAKRAVSESTTANLRVEKATAATTAAVEKYGAESLQAREAAQRLAQAHDAQARAAEKAAKAERDAATAGERVAKADREEAEAAAQATRREEANAAAAAHAARVKREAAESASLAAARVKKDAAAVAAAERFAARDAAAAEDVHTSSLRRLGGAMDAVGTAARLGLSVGLLAFGAAAASTVKIGVNYQNQLNMMQAVTHSSGEEMAQVAKKARDLGNDLTLPATSAGDAAQAMTELAKGNLTAKQAMDAAKGTLQLAAAAQITGAEAAKIQADALGAFSLKAGQAGHVADVLANAANSATGEISDFAQGLAASSAVAHQFGLSVDDTVTALALFANAGIHGSDAGTSLKSALLALASPSDQAADALKVLNVHAFDAKGRFVGLEAISQQLAKAQGKLSQQTFAAATSTAFGSDAARAAGVLAANGAVGWDKMSAAISRSGGAATAAGSRMEGLGGAWAGLKSQLETLQIDVFTAAAPILERFVRVLADGFPKALSAVSAGFHSVNAPVAAFVSGVKAVEDGFKPIGGLLGAVADGFKPIGPLFAGIGAAGDAATSGLKPMGSLLGGFVNMGPLIGETGKLMGAGIKPIGPLMKTTAEEAKRAGLHRLFYDIGAAVGQTVVFIRRNMPTWREWAHVAAQAATIAGAALGGIAGFVSKYVGPALVRLVGWVNDNRYAFAAFGAETLAVLGRIGGNFLIMAGYAVKAVGYIIGAWATLLHGIMSAYGSILEGGVTAFGWVPGLGDKLRGARNAFGKFAAGVNEGMTAAAKAAGVTGDALIVLGHKTVDASDKAVQLRKRMSELHSRQLVIQAIDRATVVAARIRAAVGRVSSRTVSIYVTQNGTVQQVQREIDQITGHAVSIQVGTVRGPGARAEAHGGIIGADTGGARGGLTWVGEAGRELVRLPYGSTVYPHGQSEGMAAASSGGGGQVVIQVQPGGSGLDRLFVDWLREAVRGMGGVNVVFPSRS